VGGFLNFLKGEAGAPLKVDKTDPRNRTPVVVDTFEDYPKDIKGVFKVKRERERRGSRSHWLTEDLFIQSAGIAKEKIEANLQLAHNVL
jgi:hypothetical protein